MKLQRVGLLLALLVMCSPALANSVTLPAEIHVGAGRLLKISAVTDGTVLKWISGRPEDADVIASESGLWAIFSSPKPGRYRVYAYTAAAGVPSDAALCTVIVDQPAPPTPTPTPVPPVPPTPPPPIPPTPPVPDALTASLKAEYDIEIDPSRATHKANLANVYRQGAAIVASNPNLATWGDVFTNISAVAGALNVKGKIPEMQKVIAAELSKTLPVKPTTPLDASGRALGSVTFLHVAQALDAVK